ncbi:hypothetical protein BZG02_03070 [Labilibaculum filiforme]|uniref:HTH lacI-type domain-containing protein n=2 Tax=Labilibaculum filiforme TaxID=1940526 RepID=A0A2N3I3G9_9BACT|nr:hypothetical protein BZG02_03070 [Labilibaculum filiforme]
MSKRLNISKSTISIVLNGHGDEKRVSKDTQETIIKFAEENNYRANQLARGLSRGKSDMIGLVIPNISDSFYARIARRIETKARLSGYNVIFSSTGESKERESELIESMLDRQVDGLIIASTQQNEEDILRLKKSNFPFVLIDRRYPDIETNFVGVDNVGGVAMAVEQLVKMGRKRIGFITLKPGLEAIHERLVGYQQTMKKFELEVKDGFVHELNYETFDEQMPAVFEIMLNSSNDIDGIVFATHFLTASGLREMKRRKVLVPNEVAIVSFGQMSAFDLVDPPITSIAQPVEDLGGRAVDILLENLKDGITAYKQEMLDSSIEVRKSCGA